MKLLNGNMTGDEEGELTFVGKQGETVIDYVWIEEENLEEVTNFEILWEGGSDHLPMVVDLKGKGVRKERNRTEYREVEVWSDEATAKFRAECEKLVWEGRTIDEKLEDLNKKVKECVTRKRIRVRERGEYVWWNKECEKKSRELKMMLRNKKKKRLASYRKEIVNKRNELEEVKKRSREENDLVWREKIESVKTEFDMLNLIRNERKKKEGICETITDEDWRNHFKDLFEGEEIEEGRETEDRLKGELTFTDEEIELQIKKLKKNKATGEDGIKNEAWLYGPDNVRQRLVEIIKEIGKGGGFPKGWRKGVISPIYLKVYYHITKERHAPPPPPVSSQQN